MPTRHRIEQRPVVTVSSGGGTPTYGNLEWGPDLGEGAGSDGKTFAADSTLAMPALSLGSIETVGNTTAITAAAANYSGPTEGSHLSGTVLGAPFWQSATTKAATATPIVIDKPAGTAIGDLLVAFVSITTNGVSTPTITRPSGWTLWASDIVHGAANATRADVFAKIADGTEGTTISIVHGLGGGTLPRVTGEIHRIIGQNPVAASVGNASASATLLGTALTPDPVSPSVTTTVPNCLVFAFLAHDHLTLPQSHTAPANHVEVADFESTNTTNITSATADYRVFAAAGATGTATHDCTEIASTDAVMHRIAIAPGTLTIA